MMKKSFINKTVKALTLACALFAVLSCNNGTELEQKESGVLVRLSVHNLEEYKNAQKSSGGFDKAERTVNPVIELDELTEFVFSGAKTGDSQQTLATFDSIKKMPEKIEIPVAATKEEWTFILSAKKGNSVIMGSKKATLKNGDNELEIAVSLESLADGTGNFAITVDFSTATNCDKITRAEAYIENKDSSSVSGFNKLDFGYDSSYSYYINSDYTFTYVGENLPKGTYRAVVKLYDCDVLLGYWQDLINISDSLTSSTTATIDKLNKAYDVDYYIYRSDEAADDSLDFEPVYVLSATATKLPEPARDDYVFMGWYTDYDLTKPVVLPLTQDTNLYAYWESLIPPADGSYYPAKAETVASVIGDVTTGSFTAPAVIKVFGKIDSDTLSDICQAIKDNNYDNNSVIYYSIDLSKTFGLTAIPDSAFYNCTNLAGFVIPDSVTEIGDYAFLNNSIKEIEMSDSITKIGSSAFQGCHYIEEIEIPESVVTIGDDAFGNMKKLESITVSTMNQNYKSIDGVLYSIDGKVLISFPKGKNINKYDIPSGVETIKSYAFSGAQYITEITIPDSVTYILDAFRDFKNLETVNIGSGIKHIDRFDFLHCTELATINISSDNTYYYVDSNDGALYSADGKVLVLYPNGNTRIAFNVPASVELIDYPILADAENLTQVVFPNDGAAWYCGSKTYSQIDLILKGTKMNISDYSENCSTLKNDNGKSCIKINNFQSVLDEFFGTNTPEVTVYNAKSTVVDIGNTEPEYTSITAGDDYTFYKIKTEIGSTYNVNFVDSDTCSNYTLPDNWAPDDCCIIIFGNDGTRIIDEENAPTLLSFVAKTSETYIGLLGNGSESICAIRVWAQIVKTGITVEVKSSDVEVTVTEYDGNTHFEAAGIYDSYKWYFDGKLVEDETGNTYDFYTSSKGVHLITLEVEKDGLYYSYSAQVIVKESHEAQC